jgi:hypothetical protein
MEVFSRKDGVVANERRDGHGFLLFFHFTSLGCLKEASALGRQRRVDVHASRVVIAIWDGMAGSGLIA